MILKPKIYNNNYSRHKNQCDLRPINKKNYTSPEAADHILMV